MKTKIRWIIDLGDLIDRRVKLETREGVVRTGVLSEVRWHIIELCGQEVGLPVEFVLNAEEIIPAMQIKYMKAVDARG